MGYNFTVGDIDAEIVDFCEPLPNMSESYLEVTKDFARRLALYKVAIEIADAAKPECTTTYAK
jgi:hypothetical protein